MAYKNKAGDFITVEVKQQLVKQTNKLRAVPVEWDFLKLDWRW